MTDFPMEHLCSHFCEFYGPLSESNQSLSSFKTLGNTESPLELGVIATGVHIKSFRLEQKNQLEK
jgi:hypothetical protein